MLMRLRRPVAVLVLGLLPASLALAACGGSDDSGLQGFDAVSVSGPVGEEPTIDWKGTLDAGKVATKVVSEGDGAAVADGDVVLLDFTIANGYTQKVSYTTYPDVDDHNHDYNVASLIKVGADAAPQSVIDLLTQSVVGQIKPGQTIGSRIAVTTGSDEIFGDYLTDSSVVQAMSSMGIGNEDGLLIVADLTAVAGPTGDNQKAPAWAPKIVEEDGMPASLDFSDAPAPSGQLEVATLVKGSGPVVKSGQQILASYLGEVSKGKKPFDESYSAGRGLDAVVGGKAATVVKGWSQGLVGQRVGSRVLLEVPPSLGYGAKAKGDIPANSTLYFVVDILDVSDVRPAPKPSETPSPTDTASPTDTTSPTDKPAPKNKPRSTASSTNAG